MTDSAVPTVMTFYRFVTLADPTKLRDALARAGSDAGVTGTVLLAREGINATLAGARRDLDAFRRSLAAFPELAGLSCRFSSAHPGNPVFYRLKVRVKTEIVRLDQGDVPVPGHTGEHVDAHRFNRLLDDPDVLVLDCRNDYEVAIGSFPGAVNPGTRSFRELPDWARRHLDPARHTRIAMFCTGGIRCEKASAWFRQEGFEAVYQLDGGILSYLQDVPPEDSRWQGECFVFDQRVSLDADLAEGSFAQCFACRRPLSAYDRASPDYREGVSCPNCIGEHTDAQRAAFRERARQQALAVRRGRRHVGAAT